MRRTKAVARHDGDVALGRYARGRWRVRRKAILGSSTGVNDPNSAMNRRYRGKIGERSARIKHRLHFLSDFETFVLKGSGHAPDDSAAGLNEGSAVLTTGFCHLKN
jgi:hypothetical protein